MELGEKARMFTNVYVKNINEEYDEARLNDMFEKYGKISSVKVFFSYFTKLWYKLLYKLQLNKQETDPYFLHPSQNLISDCLLIYLNFQVLA